MRRQKDGGKAVWQARLPVAPVIVFVVVAGFLGSPAGVPQARQAAKGTITPEAIRRHVVELAGDAYEGRGAGYAGERKAAAYIAGEFRRIGLAPAGDRQKGEAGYFQEFKFHPSRPPTPWEILNSRNVAGFLEGSDPRLKKEIVVLGAHYDGQGRTGQADPGRLSAEAPTEGDDIWNSADDNASSVAALIETARVAATKAMRPRRSLLFIAFGAEEHGLAGSVHHVRHFTSERESPVAMINLEKLGRVPEQSLVVATTSTSRAWADVLEEAAAASGVEAEALIPEIVTDTDHYPFAAARVPAIVIGTVHERDTHRPTDSADKISYQALSRRADYVLAALLAVANREQALVFSGELVSDPGLQLLPLSRDELRSLDLPPGNGALKVSAVPPGLPAERAGVMPGDVLIEINGTALNRETTDEEIVAEASRTEPEGPIRLALLRQGKKLVVELNSNP